MFKAKVKKCLDELHGINLMAKHTTELGIIPEDVHMNAGNPRWILQMSAIVDILANVYSPLNVMAC